MNESKQYDIIKFNINLNIRIKLIKFYTFLLVSYFKMWVFWRDCAFKVRAFFLPPTFQSEKNLGQVLRL